MDKNVIQVSEKLILAIQERECLWNQKNEHYHSRDVQWRTWNEVVSSLFKSSIKW